MDAGQHLRPQPLQERVRRAEIERRQRRQPGRQKDALESVAGGAVVQPSMIPPPPAAAPAGQVHRERATGDLAVRAVAAGDQAAEERPGPAQRKIHADFHASDDEVTTKRRDGPSARIARRLAEHAKPNQIGQRLHEHLTDGPTGRNDVDAEVQAAVRDLDVNAGDAVLRTEDVGGPFEPAAREVRERAVRRTERVRPNLYAVDVSKRSPA